MSEQSRAGPKPLEGGCECGAVRYRLNTTPFDAGFCHCTTCRGVSGAPVLAYASVPSPAFVLLQGEPRRRRSSSFGERTFCADCGTQLTMQMDQQPETTDFTVASLDTPEAVNPEFHLWTSSRIEWFDVADDRPRYAASRPHTAGT